MVIGVRSWELLLPGAQSLKDKRAVLTSLKDRLHNQFNVSAAETGQHDLWQRAEVTVCLVPRIGVMRTPCCRPWIASSRRTPGCASWIPSANSADAIPRRRSDASPFQLCNALR